MTPPRCSPSITLVAALLAVLVAAGCASRPVAGDAKTPVPVSSSSTQTPPLSPPLSPPPSTPVAVDADATPSPFELTRPEIARFIDEVSRRHGLDADALRALLAQGRHQPRIIAAISRPAETVLKWWEYRARLVTAERVKRGADFWLAHQDRLAATAAKTGVDPAYIVAIIGIETNFGRNKGSWRVLDALMTLGFDYPPRQAFFLQELEQFLLLVNEEKLDPLTTLGSYAGAMGAPQFMPSSYRRFATNGPLEGALDPRRDLFDSWDDVIASVANYFVAHGWRAGDPVLAEATAPLEAWETIDRRNLRLDTTVAALRGRGIGFDGKFADETAALLLQAELEDRPNVRVGFHNFTVITRYNRSNLYAMAVHDLAQAIVTTRTRERSSPIDSAASAAP